MQAKFVQEGNVLDYTNTGAEDINYRDVVVCGERIFISADNIRVGETGGIRATGVYEMDAVVGVEFTVGEKVYYDTESKLVTNVKGNIIAGIVAEPKTSGDSNVVVKIN